MPLGRVALTALLAAAIGLGPVEAQTTGPAVAVDTAITGWLELVSRRAGGAAWHGAGPYFQHRIDQRRWEDWVSAQRPRLGALGSRRAVAVAAGRDEAPLPELDWIVATFESSRPAGGRILERVWAWREDDGPFRVVNYGVWPDPEAVVHNAYLDPVPYAIAWGGSLGWHGAGLGVRRARPKAAPAPARGTAVANPATHPRRPPRRP